MRICKHLFWTNFLVLSPESKVLWLFASAHADRDGIVQINLDVMPKLVGLSKEQGIEAIEELGQHNFYDDDQPPFLSRYKTSDWDISRICPWVCRSCLVFVRASIPLDLREAVLSVARCAHCGSTENLEVDHICPVSLGGGNDRENLQALCQTCNRRKLNRFIG